MFLVIPCHSLSTIVKQLWLRYVDDTFVTQEAKQSTITTTHNSQDPHIQFTIEEPNQEGALPFLDTLVCPGPNNTLVTTVYRKPTHTDQYLHWDSNHFITAKNNAFNTLAFRAEVVCTSQQALLKEMEHIRKVLHGLLTLYKTNLTANTTSTMDKQP